MSPAYCVNDTQPDGLPGQLGSRLGSTGLQMLVGDSVVETRHLERPQFGITVLYEMPKLGADPGTVSLSCSLKKGKFFV